MKALIRKYPTNAVSTENNEVWLEPWHNADEQGRPYTLEGYRYALCTNVPDEPVGDENDDRLNLDRYEVIEHTKEVPSEDPEGGSTTIKYWTAIYNPGENQ